MGRANAPTASNDVKKATEMTYRPPFQDIFEATVEKAQQMIAAHTAQFGKRPRELSMPSLNFKVDGIDVKFHHLPNYFSYDDEVCLHHEFTESK